MSEIVGLNDDKLLSSECVYDVNTGKKLSANLLRQFEYHTLSSGETITLRDNAGHDTWLILCDANCYPNVYAVNKSGYKVICEGRNSSYIVSLATNPNNSQGFDLTMYLEPWSHILVIGCHDVTLVT